MSRSDDLTRTVLPAVAVALLSAALTWLALRALTPEIPPVGPGEVRVRLLRHDGSPTECLATLWEVRDSGARRIHPDSTARCDEAGWLVWTGREPGSWRLIASGPDIVQLDEAFELAEGQGLDLGERRQALGGRVRGVVTRDGEPVPQARVFSSSGVSTVADPKGRYKLEGVPAGTLGVRAAAGHAGGEGRVEVRAGEASELDIALVLPPARGVVGVRVEDGEGGVVVAEVLGAGPAFGVLRAGDVLTAIDGQAPSDLADAKERLSGEVGAPVELRWLRRGEPMSAMLIRASSHDL